MGRGEGTGDEEEPAGPPPALSERTWRHPSEVAMLQRQRKRRTQRLVWIALGAAMASGSWIVFPRLFDHDSTHPAVRHSPVDDLDDRSDRSSWAHAVSAGARVSTVAVRTTADTSAVAAAVVLHHGHLVTSSRALGEGTTFVVLLEDGTSTGASLVGRDPTTDIAVLSFEGTLPPAEVTAMPMRAGDPVAVVAPHERVHADTVASPATVASSADGDPLLGVISLTKSAGPGAGGPVVDADGAIVGIVATTAPDTPAAVVPVAVATRVAEQLIADGVATHAWLGVRVVDADGRISVEAVDPRGPAASVDVRVGDLLTTLDGITIDGSAALIAQLWTYRPGTRVAVGIERAGLSSEHEVELGASTAD